MSPDRNLLVFAGFNGAMAVALGAFAAHGAAPAVKTLLTTGGQYQMVHAALAVALALWNSGGRLARLAGWLASGGGLVFCLALAMIGLLSLPAMGAIAPIGGVMMIAAWCLIVAAALKPSPTNV
ncbi:DUF423 domain-containing protein [Brevundimonas sp. 3P9-tot-E]|jgi:uncharacterized membrane protein YgdD (TMEM256/DUF423 family)|uniref:DUF423 domain-containing protein n=1 Tax=Brevundimonas TaxID=41275 RepID=UPI001906003D|nr:MULTISPECIES: DUF423 domain-containing protein [Brevundimonas]MBK1969051.1 DUF423 domain-containing protein [Brevundimonas diminuta]MBK1975210.1 DUF423 domain-containing protein [Brevundimonas diminuta]MDA0744439.1 DUF423 domain-containing protein [Pseudomonadota bacterium]MDM8351640.1 DUF423 domain-containing protein [Brevundimonas diminuta]